MRAVRQLDQSGPINVDAEEVIVARLVGAPRDIFDMTDWGRGDQSAAPPGKDDFPPVVRQVGGGDHSFARIEDAFELAPLLVRR